MFCMLKKNQKISPAFFPKHNSNREKQVNLLLIQNEEKRKVKSEGRKAKSEGHKAKFKGHKAKSKQGQ